jgi:hypothetical protein
MGFVWTHVLTPTYLASTPFGFVDVFWVILCPWSTVGYGGKGCCSLADVETGLDGKAIDILGDDETY